METTKNRWTSLKAVKIISFILIIAACFSFLSRGFNLLLDADDTGVYPDIIFADLDSDRYFFNTNMWWAQNDAWHVLQYGSEDSIRAGQHLLWELETHSGWSNHLQRERFWRVLTLTDTVTGWRVGTLMDRDTMLRAHEWDVDSFDFSDIPFMTEDIFDEFDDYALYQYEIREQRRIITRNILPHDYNYDIDFGLRVDSFSARRELENIAISHQLDAFQHSLDRLSNTEGLLFLISPATPEHFAFVSPPISNVSEENRTPEFFLGHSVSHAEDNIYLAFDDTFVRYRMDSFLVIRDAHMWSILSMVSQVIIALLLFVVLMCGVGRKHRTEGVHFTPVDKPYLDIGLATVFAVTAFAIFLFAETFQHVWGLRQSNMVVTHLVFAAASIVIAAPILLWFMSFAKRVKAGKFWKHTLIYFVLAKVLCRGLQFCIKESRNLWAGAKLTIKIAVIAAVAFLLLFIVGIIGMESRFSPIPVFIASLFFGVAISVSLLLYAKRIHALDEAVKKTSEGDYDSAINVGGGELGSIAASINNIMEGISTAVEQRMKSERLKTELITNVSHDIRTPLTSIITYTDLLKHEGLHSEKAHEYLDILTQKSERLKTLTDELFEAAKAASGNIDVNLSDLNISSLLSQVLGENDSAIKDSGLDIRTNFPDKLIVRADGRLMQRALENLLSNALKYSLPASRIYIDVAETQDKYMKLDIKNISATELNFDPSELVERFKRGDDSRSDGGNGLGLSIVQSFIYAQGGKFDIAIDGDLFKATVTLPLS